MRKYLVLITACLLIFSPILTAQSDEEIDLYAPHDSFWNGFNEGCIGRNIAYDVFWSDFDTDLSLNSFTIGFIPDTNNGPAFLARLNTGVSGGYFQNNPKTVFLSWSLGGTSCIIKTDFDKCKEANKVMNDLQKIKIAVNENFDNKHGLTASHATSYYLKVLDGSNHFNQWEITSGKSDIEKTITESSLALYQCSKEAANDLFERLKINSDNDQYTYHSKRFNLDKK